MDKKNNPNEAFKHKKHPYASPRPYQPVLFIRCDGNGCGHKMSIMREKWTSEEEIVCPGCGETTYWGIL